MNFPRYWQVLQTGKARTWDWSDTSDEEALATAGDRQRRDRREKPNSICHPPCFAVR